MSDNTTSSNKSLLNDAGTRAIIFQVVLLAVVVFVSYYLFSNLQANLANQGISTGFEFLNQPAGFPILSTLLSTLKPIPMDVPLLLL